MNQALYAHKNNKRKKNNFFIDFVNLTKEELHSHVRINYDCGTIKIYLENPEPWNPVVNLLYVMISLRPVYN
jgi:hypothetical protein